VVAKAEHWDKGANPRFVVTSLTAEQFSTQALYEELYCARGEMENRIKEQQLAPVLLHVCLPTDARLAAARSKGHGNGSGAMSDDPVEAAQDGRTDPGDGAAGGAFAGQWLSAAGDVWAGLSQCEEHGLKPAPLCGFNHLLNYIPQHGRRRSIVGRCCKLMSPVLLWASDEARKPSALYALQKCMP
jgi:hypothetical protein